MFKNARKLNESIQKEKCLTRFTVVVAIGTRKQGGRMDIEGRGLSGFHTSSWVLVWFRWQIHGVILHCKR